MSRIGIPDTLQRQETLPDTLDSGYILNGYLSESATELDIDGDHLIWYQVKSSVEETKVRRPLIFYNPEKKLWLKLSNPEDYAIEESDQILVKACEIGAAAMELANLNDLARQFKTVDVEISGKRLKGFVSPHVGATLEYFMNINSSWSEAELNFFRLIYEIAFKQAVKLYIEYGYWRSDPNPGNIALHKFPDGQIQVCLIDFADPPQEMPNALGGRFVISDPIQENRRFQLRRLRDLEGEFKEQCLLHGIPFELDLEQIL